MFSLPFQGQLYDGEEQDSFSRIVQPPPIARVDVIKGAGWDETQGDDINLAAAQVIARYNDQIVNFFMGQQQNADNMGSGGQWAHEIQFEAGALVARHVNNQGTAMLHVEVRPTNTSGAPQGLNSGGFFDIKIPFTGYPVNLTPDAMKPWGLYAWDWLQNGACGIAGTAFQGLEYFEVEVKTLPDGTPPSEFFPQYADDDGVTTATDIWTIDTTGETLFFPGDLKDFLTPTIGIVPSQFTSIPNRNSIIPAVMPGTDAGATEARSISVSPSKGRWTNLTGTIWDDATYWISDPAVWEGDASLFPSYFDVQLLTQYTTDKGKVVNSLMMWEDTNPDSRKDADKTKFIGIQGDYLIGVNGTDVFQVSTSSGGIYFSNSYLPTEAQILAQYSVISKHELVDGPIAIHDREPYNAGYLWLGKVGGVQQIPFYTTAVVPGQNHGIAVPVCYVGTLGYQAGAFTNYSVANDYLIGTLYQGKDFDYDDYCAIGGPHYTAPVGANAFGSHAWIIKGAGDDMLNTLSPLADVDIGETPNGCWTGINLESIAVDDVIMVAVDTVHRKVWFGKNKYWYDINGQSQYTPTDPQLKPAAFLDGDTKQKYYPAAGARWGYAFLRMRFGTATKYAPPAGFTAYGLVTIPPP